MPEAETPQFRVSNEGEPIPPVDPADLRRRWSIKPGDKETMLAASQEANCAEVSKRSWMIKVLTGFNKGELLAPWKHGEDLDDAVFRVAATFPIRPLRQNVYKVPGDSNWGFDPNAFVEKLIEETGISHTWEPVSARIPEGSGGCAYSTIRLTVKRQGSPDTETVEEALKKRMAGDLSEREAKHDARELLWAVWSKCQPKLSRPSRKMPDEHAARSVAMLFADFAIDNIDLAREFVSWTSGRDRLTILLELERGAKWLDLECTVCQRLMREHSDEDMTRCYQAVPPGTPPYRFPNS